MRARTSGKSVRGTPCRGKEIVEIHPVYLGGSPTDLANKAVVTRKMHIALVVFWNRKIRELRRQERKTRD